eukprot:scaffold52319_cov29-Phaeocystis_antarctica.AAC.2
MVRGCSAGERQVRRAAHRWMQLRKGAALPSYTPLPYRCAALSGTTLRVCGMVRGCSMVVRGAPVGAAARGASQARRGARWPAARPPATVGVITR